MRLIGAKLHRQYVIGDRILGSGTCTNTDPILGAQGTVFEGFDLEKCDRVAIKIITHKYSVDTSNSTQSKCSDCYPFIQLSAPVLPRKSYNNDYLLKLQSIFHETKVISILKTSEHVIKIRDVIVESFRQNYTCGSSEFFKDSSPQIEEYIFIVMDVCIDSIDSIFFKLTQFLSTDPTVLQWLDFLPTET